MDLAGTYERYKWVDFGFPDAATIKSKEYMNKGGNTC